MTVATFGNAINKIMEKIHQQTIIEFCYNGNTHKLRRNPNGKYCLNDIHKASGGLKKDEVAYWKCLNATKELIKQVCINNNGLVPIQVVEGRNGGTWGSLELLISYVNWIARPVSSIVLDALGVNAIHVDCKRKEFQFGEDIVNNLFSDYTILPQYPVFEGKYRIDWYIPELKLAIEFDEKHHVSQSEADIVRQREIEVELGCKFIRYKQ